MVKPNIQNKSSATNAHPPGPQAISTSVGESPDSLNLISRASSRAASGVICVPQAPLSTSLMSHGPNHGTAESSSEIEGGSAVAGTCVM